MRTASWIVLTIITLLLILGSIGSLTIAYFVGPQSDIIRNSTSLADLEISQEIESSLRGRRGTAASFGLAFSVLLLMTILGPYRQGSVWAWWAIMISSLLLAAGILARVPALGTAQGAATGWFFLLVVVAALALDVKRLTRNSSTPAE